MAIKGVFDNVTPDTLDDRDAFNPTESWGRALSSPTLRFLPYAYNSFALSPLNTFYRTSMAYFNNINNANFYPTSSTSGEFGMYPLLSQMSANEEQGQDIPTHDPFTNGWRMDEQPGHMIGSLTSLQAEASFGKHHQSPHRRVSYPESPESVSSATPYVAPTHDHNLQPHPGNCRLSTGQSTQSHRYGIVSRDNSFASTVASEAPAVVPVPSSGKYFSPVKI
jgi:hypothetical protein